MSINRIEEPFRSECLEVLGHFLTEAGIEIPLESFSLVATSDHSFKAFVGFDEDDNVLLLTFLRTEHGWECTSISQVHHLDEFSIAHKLLKTRYQYKKSRSD